MTNPALFFPLQKVCSHAVPFSRCPCTHLASLLRIFGSPFPGLPLPCFPQRTPGSTANCLLTFQGDISSTSHSASSVSSKHPLSLLTQGTPSQLLMLYSLSLHPPSEISTATKNSGMRQLICIISIGGLKTKSFCNNFPVRTTETIVRQKNVRNGSCKIYLKAFILSYHNVAKETKYSFPFV